MMLQFVGQDCAVRIFAGQVSSVQGRGEKESRIEMARRGRESFGSSSICDCLGGKRKGGLPTGSGMRGGEKRGKCGKE